MMNRFLIVLVLGALMMPETAMDAQTVIVRKRNIDQEDSRSRQQSSPRSRRYYENNATTINLYGLTNGHLDLGYERRLSDLFSLEAGMGLTFDNPLDATYDLFLDNQATNFYESGSASMGNSQFMVFKVHPQNNAMRNSPYVGFRGGRRQYVRGFDNHPNASRTLIDTGVQLGYQVRSGEYWYADMFIVLNRLQTISDRISLSQVYDPDTQQIIDVVDINPETNDFAQGEAATTIRPMLNLGFKFGFAF